MAGGPGARPLSAAELAQHVSGIVGCGFCAGLVTAGVLNPWDRALYLSVKDRRRFFHPANWRSPYQGLSQTIVQRASTSGLYFPLEQATSELLQQRGVLAASPAARGWLTGCIVGTTNGVAFNWMAAIKYASWGLPENKRSFRQTAQSMWCGGGIRPFVRGTAATVVRDVVFGSFFSGARGFIKSRTDNRPGAAAAAFLGNFAAAAVATVGSSPFNYARNMQYATEHNQPGRSTPKILGRLLAETSQQPRPLVYLSQRLCVGWGTLRVATGMAMAAQLYDRCQGYRAQQGTLE